MVAHLRRCAIKAPINGLACRDECYCEHFKPQAEMIIHAHDEAHCARRWNDTVEWVLICAAYDHPCTWNEPHLSVT